MKTARIILVEHIRHDPLAGTLSGVAVHRDRAGCIRRQRVVTAASDAILTHADADARIRRSAALL